MSPKSGEIIEEAACSTREVSLGNKKTLGKKIHPRLADSLKLLPCVCF